MKKKVKRVVKKETCCEEVIKGHGFWNIAMFKWTVTFATLFVVGLLGYWIEPTRMINFIIKYKWVWLVLMIICMMKPMRKFCVRCK